MSVNVSDQSFGSIKLTSNAGTAPENIFSGLYLVKGTFISPSPPTPFNNSDPNDFDSAIAFPVLYAASLSSGLSVLLPSVNGA